MLRERYSSEEVNRIDLATQNTSISPFFECFLFLWQFFAIYFTISHLQKLSQSVLKWMGVFPIIQMGFESHLYQFNL